MNVKTIKRISKRSVSMLLSVLMVLSLFTVCLVGTTVTAGAYNADSNATIYYSNVNSNWSQVYIVYGGDGGSYNSYKVQQMTSVEGSSNLYSATITGYTNMHRYFFTNQAISWSDSAGVETAFNSIPDKINKTQLCGSDLKENTYVISGALENNGYKADISKLENEVASIDGATIYVDATAIDWKNNIYLYVGHSGYTKKYILTYNSTTKYHTATLSGSFTDRTHYFISTNGDVVSDGEMTGISTKYSSDSTGQKTALYSETLLPLADGNLYTYQAGTDTPYKTELSVYYPNIYWVDATLYNYRNYEQIKYNSDWADGEATDQLGVKPYADYNAAVADWYRVVNKDDSTHNNIIPLYQGNFRATNANNTVEYITNSSSWQNMFWHFVSVANGTNRSTDPTNKSAKAAAIGLTDSTLGGRTLTQIGSMTSGDLKKLTISQYGIEMPQFSTNFKNYYNDQKVRLKYGPNGSYNGITQNYDTDNEDNQYSFKTIQTEYNNLKFQFDKTTTSNGNTKYYYYAGENNNRYYDPSTATLRKGATVTGVRGGGADSNQAGYYPFNKVNPSRRTDIVNSYGTRFDIEFEMPSANYGYQMKGSTGRYEDLVFNFYGDDDVWVYIDGYLALDLGGSHNGAGGSINLSQQTYTMNTGYYNSGDRTTFNDTGSNRTWWSATNTPANKATVTDVSISPSGGITYTNAESVTKALAKNLDDTDSASGAALTTSLQNTDKVHTLTVFYMERGEYDSNFAMDFMLPVGSDTNFSVEQKLNNDNVNSGLLTKTLNVANKDLFGVNVTSNSTTNNSSNNSTAVITSGTKLERARDVANPSNKTALQDYTSSTQKVKGFTPATSAGSYAPLTAYYQLTDKATADNTKDGTPLASSTNNEGVGVPTNSGDVLLQYGQKAVFNDQFDVDTNLHITMNEDLRNYTTTRSSDTGWYDATTAKIFNSEDRKVSDFYNSELVVTDANGNTVSASGPTDDTNYYSYSNTGTAQNKKAKVSAVVTNEIKTTSFSVTKKLATDTESQKHKAESFTFKIKCTSLFGEDVDDFVPDGLKYKIGTTEYTYNDRVGIALQDGQTAIFEGIPVGSVFEIVESVATDADKLIVNVKDKTTGASDTATVKSEITADNANKKATVTIGTEETSATIAGDFENSYQLSVVPVLYRYFDRNIVAGKPTSKEEHYTYYLKWLDGGSSAFVDGAKPGDGTVGVTAEYIRNYIVPNAETVDNIQFKYSLATDSISTNQYWINNVPTYRKTFDTDDPFTSEDDKTAEGLQACLDDINAKDYKGYIIIAEHKDAPAKYTVTAYYPDTVAGQGQVKKANVEFNTVMPKHTIEAEKKATYSVNGSSKECTFGYWERLVTVRKGGVAQTVWTPVTSNYDYGLRVCETTTLRAVYYYEEGGNKHKVAYGTDYSDPTDSTFELLDDVYGSYPVFEVFKAYTYNYFYIDKVLIHHYNGDGTLINTETVEIKKWHMPTDNSYNSIEPQAGTYKEFNTKDELEAYLNNTPNVKENYPSSFKILKEEVEEFNTSYYNKTVGNDSTATDRTYDMYTKTTSNKDGSANVQSRTRINVIFGAAGSPDTDKEITNVGYVLFKNPDAYNSYSFTQEQLENYINGTTSYSGGAGSTMTVKTYDVKYISTGQNNGETYKPLGTEVNLTNKNRYQIVFDTASDNTSYFTCYTFMIRKEKDKKGNLTGKSQLYVSDTPANFRALEAEYIIDTTNNAVQKEYYVNKSSVSTEVDQPALGTVDTNSVVAVPGKYFTINATPMVSADGTKKGKLVKMTVGHKVITEENELNEFISTEGCTKLIDISEYLTEEERADTTILNIEAVFEPIENGITVRLPSVSGVKVNVHGHAAGSLIKYDAGKVTVTAEVQDGNSVLLVNGNGFTVDDKGKNAGKTVTITEGMTDDEFTAAITPVTAPGTYVAYPLPAQMGQAHVTAFSIVGTNGVTYSQGDVIPDGTTVVVSVTPETGWTITNYTNNTQTITVNHTNYPETDTFLNSLRPTSTPVTYTVTINTNVNDNSIGTARGTYTPTEGDPQPDTNSITVSVPYGTEVSLTGTLVNNTDYKFDNWTATTGATISSETSMTGATATISGDTTITANFSKRAITVYFAFVDQENHLEGDEQVNNNYAYPKDITNGGFNKPSDANDGPYWSTTNLKAYSNNVDTKYSEYMGYMSYTSGSITHKATVYKFVISNIGSTVYFTAGNGGQQTNTATLEANKVYFASGSVSSQKPNITSNYFSSWTVIEGTEITLTSGIDYDKFSPVWAIHYWNDTSGVAGWSVMSKTATNNEYRTIIPSDATGMILVRVNPAKNIGNWDNTTVWDKTGNLTVSAGTKLTINAWGLKVSQSN